MTVSTFTRWTSSGPSSWASWRTPSWSTQRRIPRPTSWRLEVSDPDSLSVQIWKMLGLSQPSRRAEWLKTNRTGTVKNLAHFPTVP